MSEIKILNIHYRNFKALRKFDLKLGGQDADLIAQNGSGKTTAADGFQWLVSDKNSANDKKFSIKTLQESGEPIHGFDHEVGMVLDVDGKDTTLQKIYREKYEKKRGSATESFTGHTNIYRIDDLKKTEKAFKARIAEIFGDEQTFRLLTDLTFFNNEKAFGWEKRRASLIKICGDVTEADVIASTDELAGLSDVLNGRTVDELKSWLKEQRKKINEDLEEIQPRIDEVSQGFPETTGTKSTAEKALKDLRAAAQEKHEEKARLDAGGEVAEKKRQLAEAKAGLSNIEREARAKADEEKRAESQETAAIQNRIDELTRTIQSRTNDIESRQATIALREKSMDSLREKWQAVDAEPFADKTETVCPTCERDLPEDQVDAAREKALAAFNSDKAKRLEAIDAEGKQLKTEAANLALLNEQFRKEIVDAEAERDKLTDQKVDASFPELIAWDTNLPESYDETLDEIAILESQIAQLGEGSTDALTAITAEIADLQQQIRDGEETLAAFAQVAQGKARIEELSAQEKDLAAEYEEYERQLHLCEEFTKAQAAMLTDRINSRFGMTKFKLFETQINEGIKPCCIATYQGKPYPDLSTGEQIHIGLDIINTLSEYYDIICPVFVDHAESLTSPIRAAGQVIRLIAREGVSELRVETKTKEEANV